MNNTGHVLPFIYARKPATNMNKQLNTVSNNSYNCHMLTVKKRDVIFSLDIHRPRDDESQRLPEDEPTLLQRENVYHVLYSMDGNSAPRSAIFVGCWVIFLCTNEHGVTWSAALLENVTPLHVVACHVLSATDGFALYVST